MKISKIVKLVIITLITITAFLLIPGHKVQAASKLKLDVSYSYDKKKDVVTVKVKSNNKLKDTKSTWKLSKKGYTYTKKFYANQKYEMTFTDIYGNKKTKKIKVKQIKGPQITVEYKYDSSKNKVKVSVKSNKKLADTKPTWTLSKKKYTYTKFFKANQKYETTFTDTYGNKKTKKIKVTQIDDVGPKATITYTYSSDAKSVVVTITSNEELIECLNNEWKLSSDKKTYAKTFTTNTEFGITLKDKYKNSTPATIKITGIGKTTSANTNTSVSVGNSNNNNNTSTSAKKDVYKGIDVSAWQENIDWEKVKKSGIDFAIIRSGYRGYAQAGTLVEDKELSRNIIGTSANNINVGLYFFTQAKTTEEAKEEAKFVLKLIKKYGIQVYYPIVIDTELSSASPSGSGRADKLSISERTAVVKKFCKTIKDSGYTPMIYASTSWLNNKLDMTQLSQYDVWVAHYGVSKPTYTGKYTIWQYTSKGKVDGISGYVDLDYCYKQY